jgi:hypothetical protein
LQCETIHASRITMPVQQIFSAKALVGVWRNLRNTRDQNDFYLTLQYHQDEARGSKGKKYGKTHVVETTSDLDDGKAVDTGKSISFVVPWRSMQAQRRELREKEKELAEALVMLAGEVSFTGTYLPTSSHYPSSQHSLTNIYRTVTYPSSISHTEPSCADSPSCSRHLATDVQGRTSNG